MERTCAHARASRSPRRRSPIEVLNDACSTSPDPRRRRRRGDPSAIAAVQRTAPAGGGNRLASRAAIRISVSNWATSADDVDRSAAAILAAASSRRAVRARQSVPHGLSSRGARFRLPGDAGRPRSSPPPHRFTVRPVPLTTRLRSRALDRRPRELVSLEVELAVPRDEAVRPRNIRCAGTRLPGSVANAARSVGRHQLSRSPELIPVTMFRAPAQALRWTCDPLLSIYTYVSWKGEPTFVGGAMV